MKISENHKLCNCRNLYASSVSSNEAMYRCRCGKTKHCVKLTSVQRKAFHNKLFKKPEIHKLYHRYIALKNKAKQESNYDAMVLAEKFANKNPSVKIVGVDDDVHAGSDLVIIPHIDKYHLWGLSVEYIPQCTGESPIRFFLYPGHLKRLIETLQDYAKIARKLGDKKLQGLWDKRPSAFDTLPKRLEKRKIKDFKEDFSARKPLTKTQQERLKKKLAKIRKKYGSD